MENNLETVFNNAMDLVMDLKDYVEKNKKIERSKPLDAADITLTQQVSQMTANITAMVSWLFMFKALKNNEISEQALIDEGNELIKDMAELPKDTTGDDFPIDFVDLKEQMSSLHADVMTLYKDFIHTNLN